jgi:hypothetical protein
MSSNQAKTAFSLILYGFSRFAYCHRLCGGFQRQKRISDRRDHGGRHILVSVRTVAAKFTLRALTNRGELGLNDSGLESNRNVFTETMDLSY